MTDGRKNFLLFAAADIRCRLINHTSTAVIVHLNYREIFLDVNQSLGVRLSSFSIESHHYSLSIPAGVRVELG